MIVYVYVYVYVCDQYSCVFVWKYSIVDFKILTIKTVKMNILNKTAGNVEYETTLEE